MTTENEVRPNGFGVYIEQPYQIWQNIRDALLSHRKNTGHVLSHTDFGQNAPLVKEESTEIKIQMRNWGTSREIGSTLSSGEETQKNSLLAFYSMARLISLEQILKESSVRKSLETTDIINGNSFLTFRRKGGDSIGVNMGPVTYELALAEKSYQVKYHTNRLSFMEYLRFPQSIVDEERAKLNQVQNADPADHPIKLRFYFPMIKKDNKRNRTISFLDHEAFTRNLYFYSAVYQSLLEALYQERSLPLPQKPIIISSPKHSED